MGWGSAPISGHRGVVSEDSGKACLSAGVRGGVPIHGGIGLSIVREGRALRTGGKEGDEIGFLLDVLNMNREEFVAFRAREESVKDRRGRAGEVDRAACR